MKNTQAFPMIRDMTNEQNWDYEPGMTLRDYFAAKAMQAFISHAEHGTEFGVSHAETNLRYANASYAMADAMLKAREAK